MRLIRQKKYKSKPPVDTINQIRRILQDANIFTVEHHIHYGNPGVHACRVWIGEGKINDLHIGTNGKGMTTRYSLASAYGEMMERIQNNILFPEIVKKLAFCGEQSNLSSAQKAFLSKNNADLPYYCAPDEKWMTAKDIKDECGDIIRIMYKLQDDQTLIHFLEKAFADEPTPCVPYFDFAENKTVFIPHLLVYFAMTSNGMCAGNTPKEAIIQGLSEIYERYALNLAYADSRIPIPTIPPEFFSSSEISTRLERLKNMGMKYEILDMSMGCGLPVVGLRLTREKDGKVAVHAGADPSPITALERCLTEIFQSDESDLEDKFIDVKDSLPPTHENLSSDELKEFFLEKQKFYAYGTGKPSYSMIHPPGIAFPGFEHPDSLSNTQDFEYMMRIGKNISGHILVRDNSFLGFPAYQIIIPGASEIYLSDIDNNIEIASLIRVFENSSVLSHLPNESRDELQMFLTLWEEQINVNISGEASLALFMPPGAAMPADMNDSGKVTQKLKECVANDAAVSEFFAKTHYINCFECSSCPCFETCCLIQIAQLEKILQLRHEQHIPLQSPAMLKEREYAE